MNSIKNNHFFRITFSEERGLGILTELMEGSLESHLKDKLATYKKIRDGTATREEEIGFMFVPIGHMTNWLRKAFKSIEDATDFEKI